MLGSASTHALNHFKGRAIAVTRAPTAPAESSAAPAAPKAAPAAPEAPPAAPEAPPATATPPVPCSSGAEAPEPDAPRQWLVFVDGGESSNRAARLCAGWMRDGDTAKVVALYVAHGTSPLWEERLDPHVASAGTLEAMQSEREALKEKAEKAVRDVAALMQSARPGTAPLDIAADVVEVVKVPDGIVEYAHKQAQAHPPVCGHLPRTVLLMGSRGLGTFARFWLGSCTNHVLHCCELPLIVVH